MSVGHLNDVRSVLGRSGAPVTPGAVAGALRGLGLLVSESSVRETVVALRRESAGAGPLEPLLSLRGVTDVLVNGHNQVFVDRGGGLEQVESPFEAEEDVRRLAVRLAAVVGRRLDEGSPFVDARLPDGTRVHAVLGVLTDSGTCLSLRVPSRIALTLGDWVANHSMHPRAADLLGALIDARAAFLISGGTGSGKTTLLATLLSRVQPSHRIVIVEDSRELAPAHAHVLRLEARPPNAEGAGAVGLSALVRQALRMRPDRLVVGEVRGAELADLLAALNTGHEGGCGTVHANSAADVPARLEALAALGSMPRGALHSQAAAALDVLVHIGRLSDGRRWVQELYLLQWDAAAGLCRPVPAWRFVPDGEAVAEAGAGALAEVLRCHS